MKLTYSVKVVWRDPNSGEQKEEIVEMPYCFGIHGGLAVQTILIDAHQADLLLSFGTQPWNYLRDSEGKIQGFRAV